MLQTAFATHTPSLFMAALEKLDTEGRANSFVQAIIKGGHKKMEAMRDQALANPPAASKTPLAGDQNERNSERHIAAIEVAPAKAQPRSGSPRNDASISAVVSTTKFLYSRVQLNAYIGK
jgi:hypothetical protein